MSTGIAETPTDTFNTTWVYRMFSWAYAGVDFELPGNGGVECVEFLSPQQRVVESALASLFALFVMYVAYPRLTLPAQRKSVRGAEAPGKRLLLVLMCLTWGCELGFKFATRQMIWIFNPCHVATAVQIYLLASAPSRGVTAAFRLHMHMLTGAPIAILFPVINTRLLPFETEVYYIQHILMLVIPFYLMSLGDPYIPEKFTDFTWATMTLGVLFVYHFIPLQLLAVVTRVNLNNMLCPAVSDPFHGPYYRLFAITHQCLLIPSLGKIYALLAQRLGWCPQEKEESVADLIKEELKEVGGLSSNLVNDEAATAPLFSFKNKQEGLGDSNANTAVRKRVTEEKNNGRLCEGAGNEEVRGLDLNVAAFLSSSNEQQEGESADSNANTALRKRVSDPRKRFSESSKENQNNGIKDSKNNGELDNLREDSKNNGEFDNRDSKNNGKFDNFCDDSRSKSENSTDSDTTSVTSPLHPVTLNPDLSNRKGNAEGEKERQANGDASPRYRHPQSEGGDGGGVHKLSSSSSNGHLKDH